MRPIRALIVLPLVAACAQTPSTPPRVATGPVDDAMHAVETTGRTGRRVLGLTQGSVRACSGSYVPPTAISPVRTTELACTGDVTGTATVGPGATGGRSVRWQLGTGERGRTPL